MRNHGRFFSRLACFVYAFFISQTVQAEINGSFVAGEYVVKLKDSVGIMSAQKKHQMVYSMGATIKRSFKERHDTVVIKRSIVERAEAVLEELSQNPDVAIVEPNYIYYPSNLPNDAKLDDLWGLVNKQKSAGGVDIDAEKAWRLETGSKNVVVAVIDTGVNYNHPDLKNNMWVNQAEANGVRGVDDDGNGYVDDIYGYDFANKDGDPMDDNDHGTHCAGTIGAEGNNGIGVVGVNWNVSIMAMKFLKGQGGGTLEDAMASIDYAVKMKADILSNSWGGGGESVLLRQAIERAERAGILFVAAAGNNRSDNDVSPTYPANYDVTNVISVAAVDQKGEVANFSNYGKNTVHIAAPGVDILSSTKDGGYNKFSGTSMAAPHVSGVAALLLASEPGLSYQELKARMLATSVPKVQLRNKVTNGLLNAHNALTNTVPPPDLNDPSPWPSMADSYSTPHPYGNDHEQSFTITVPGATQVAVHFSKFMTERGFDKVSFYNSRGVKFGEYSGNHTDNYSPAVPGDTIVVEFKSDSSLNDYGFDIDRVHYQGVVRDAWRSFLDPVSTQHPYRNFMDQEVVFEQSGADEIKVKFGRFEMEKRYDFVYFYDENGQQIGKWDGDHSGEFSPIAQGEKIIVRIVTDYSVKRYGFDVESVHYR